MRTSASAVAGSRRSISSTHARHARASRLIAYLAGDTRASPLNLAGHTGGSRCPTALADVRLDERAGRYDAIGCDAHLLEPHPCSDQVGVAIEHALRDVTREQRVLRGWLVTRIVGAADARRIDHAGVVDMRGIG